MARSRNIKPSFFTNDAVAENDPLGRLLFIGLWTIADFKGELEWRPKRIKAQILPYDNCDIDLLAINLDKSGFIRFYSVQGKSYVHIVNFTKHQNPHINEERKGSDVPVFDESLVGIESQVIDNEDIEINRDKSGLKPECSGTAPADSFIPYPDSLNLIPLEKPLSSCDDESSESEERQDKKSKFNFDKERIKHTWNEKASEFGLPALHSVSDTVEKGFVRLYKSYIKMCKEVSREPNDIDTVINGYIREGYKPTKWAMGENPEGKKYGIATALTQQKIDEILGGQ